MQYSEDLAFLYNFNSDQNKEKVLSAASAIGQKTGIETNTFAALDNARYHIPYKLLIFILFCFILFCLIYLLKKKKKIDVFVSDKQLSYQKMVAVQVPLRCW